MNPHPQPQTNLTALSQTLQRTSKKSITSQQNILSIINSLIGVIQKAQQDISLQQCPSSSQIKSRLQKLHSSIAQFKPLANLTRIHQEMYARISKVKKQMEKVFETPNGKSKNEVYFGELNEELLELAILEHFLKASNVGAANVMKTEYSKREIYQRGIVIYNEILGGKLTSAIEWAEGERLYQTFGNQIEFQLRKRQFLQFDQQNQVTEAIAYCRVHFAKFVDRKMSSIQQLIGFLFFSKFDHEFSPKYQTLQLLINNYQSIATQFLSVYYSHHNISQFDSLQLCLRAGLRGQSQFQQYSKLLKDHKQVLPFSVDFNEFKYHSMFVCPVTKEVSNPGDKPVVLRCGHVISEYSFNRIVDNRNKQKFKCPVCHTEQKLTEVVDMVF